MHDVTPEVRRLIVRARRNGMKVKDIVRIFGVSRKTVPVKSLLGIYQKLHIR